MKTRVALMAAWILSLCTMAWAQNGKAQLVSGPMLGYAEPRECLVWVQVKCASGISLHYTKQGEKNTHVMSMENTGHLCDPWICKFVIKDLEPGATYSYSLLLDKKPLLFPYPLTFKTKKIWAPWSKEDPYPFAFLAGSCNYVNDSLYDRPGRPYGQGTEIIERMAATPGDFMIWLGDNTYLREADFTSESGIRYRYMHTRSDPHLQKFLAAKNHYAVWDDHDFGDNDANKSYDFKDVTRDCFMQYWGNSNYGHAGEGIYSSFRYSDAEFFLVDDRWFRDDSYLVVKDNEDKNQMGALQLSWLKDKLKHSNATFKFICMGGQFLNEHTNYESYNLYKKERQELISFLVDQKITGVIFISGDRHHTEIVKNDTYVNTLGYVLYDITSSPISAGVGNVLQTAEATNPQRVPGTLLAENNYVGIQVEGRRGERTVKITAYDKNGSSRWQHVLKEAELKGNK